MLLIAALVATCGPWAHVYKPDRLVVTQSCAIVTGTIVDATAGRRKDGVRHEADGDCHGWLRVDPEFEWMLNDGNRSSEGANLVFEIVCRYPVTHADAVSACKGYKDKIVLPPVGTRVEIRGPLVRDTNHARWMELHPVESIRILGGP